jgi:hypothetical protein
MITSIDLAVNEIRASDAVAVLGAGVSFSAGMPLAGQLAPLVWHALDSNADALKALCADLGVPASSGKEVVSDDPLRVNRAFQHVKANAATLRTFKNSFRDLDLSRASHPSAPHTALARLVHAGKIIDVVSFNWDTLLESAFKRRFGFEINAQRTVVTKPHGDCLEPDGDWTLPHEDGVVPGSLLQRLNALASTRPRVLLILGYSERDAEIVKQLIRPFANRWRVIRISPAAVGEGAITLPAATALEELANQLAPEPAVPGWATVAFENQRGIEAAVTGERLGPRDVIACPRLPHFGTALDKLTLLHSVEIAGESGSGKSITVWQLAHEMHRRGWQVLRLDAAQRSVPLAAIDAIRAQGWRTVAVVDDSQIFANGTVARLRELASEHLKVILGTTDPSGEQHGAVRAAARSAVDALAAYCRSRRQTLLPLVRKLDSHIGDGFMDESIETRIDHAAKEPTPWQYAFVLRGGNRKVRELLNAARDFDQADLLLVLIAARQLAMLDAGVSVADLISACARIGKSETWVRTALDALSRQRYILASAVIRCLHLRSASAIIEASLETRQGGEYVQIATLLQDALRNPSLPLRGISWLLHTIWHPHSDTVVTDDLKAELISRCFAAKSHLEIRDACFVLERLLGRKNLAVSTGVAAHRHMLSSWVLGADAVDAYAIGRVLNNLRNDSAKQAGEFLTGLDPEAIALKVSPASMEHGYVWGAFLHSMCVDKNDAWTSSVAKHLPRDTIRAAVRSTTPAQMGDLAEYLPAIACFDFDFALELFEIATPYFARQLGQNSLDAHRELFDLSHWVLGEGLFFDTKPNQRQRKITKAIFEGLKPAEVVAGITTCRFGDWENYARLLAWVRRAHPVKHRSIVQALDWTALEAVVSDKLAEPNRELTLLLANLVADSKTNEPVGSWLRKHTAKMKVIGSRIIALCPESAPAVLSNRGKIDLNRDHVGWLFDGYVLSKVAALDQEAAREIVRSNITHFAKGVAELYSPEGMAPLLKFLASEPELLDQIMAAVDTGVAKVRWPHALGDHRSEHRKDTRDALKFVSEREKGEIGQLAAQMLRKARYRRPPKIEDNR